MSIALHRHGIFFRYKYCNVLNRINIVSSYLKMDASEASENNNYVAIDLSLPVEKNANISREGCLEAVSGQIEVPAPCSSVGENIYIVEENGVTCEETVANEDSEIVENEIPQSICFQVETKDAEGNTIYLDPSLFQFQSCGDEVIIYVDDSNFQEGVEFKTSLHINDAETGGLIQVATTSGEQYGIPFTEPKDDSPSVSNEATDQLTENYTAEEDTASAETSNIVKRASLLDLADLAQQLSPANTENTSEETIQENMTEETIQDFEGSTEASVIVSPTTDKLDSPLEQVVPHYEEEENISDQPNNSEDAQLDSSLSALASSISQRQAHPFGLGSSDSNVFLEESELQIDMEDTEAENSSKTAEVRGIENYEENSNVEVFHQENNSLSSEGPLNSYFTKSSPASKEGSALTPQYEEMDTRNENSLEEERVRVDSDEEIFVDDESEDKSKPECNDGKDLEINVLDYSEENDSSNSLQNNDYIDDGVVLTSEMGSEILQTDPEQEQTQSDTDVPPTAEVGLDDLQNNLNSPVSLIVEQDQKNLKSESQRKKSLRVSNRTKSLKHKDYTRNRDDALSSESQDSNIESFISKPSESSNSDFEATIQKGYSSSPGESAFSDIGAAKMDHQILENDIESKTTSFSGENQESIQNPLQRKSTRSLRLGLSRRHKHSSDKVNLKNINEEIDMSESQISKDSQDSNEVFISESSDNSLGVKHFGENSSLLVASESKQSQNALKSSMGVFSSESTQLKDSVKNVRSYKNIRSTRFSSRRKASTNDKKSYQNFDEEWNSSESQVSKDSQDSTEIIISKSLESFDDNLAVKSHEESNSLPDAPEYDVGYTETTHIHSKKSHVSTKSKKAVFSGENQESVQKVVQSKRSLRSSRRGKSLSDSKKNDEELSSSESQISEIVLDSATDNLISKPFESSNDSAEIRLHEKNSSLPNNAEYVSSYTEKIQIDNEKSQDSLKSQMSSSSENLRNLKKQHKSVRSLRTSSRHKSSSNDANTDTENNSSENPLCKESQDSTEILISKAFEFSEDNSAMTMQVEGSLSDPSTSNASESETIQNDPKQTRNAAKLKNTACNAETQKNKEYVKQQRNVKSLRSSSRIKTHSNDKTVISSESPMSKDFQTAETVLSKQSESTDGSSEMDDQETNSALEKQPDVSNTKMTQIDTKKSQRVSKTPSAFSSDTHQPIKSVQTNQKGKSIRSLRSSNRLKTSSMDEVTSLEIDEEHNSSKSSMPEESLQSDAIILNTEPLKTSKIDEMKVKKKSIDSDSLDFFDKHAKVLDIENSICTDLSAEGSSNPVSTHSGATLQNEETQKITGTMEENNPSMNLNGDKSILLDDAIYGDKDSTALVKPPKNIYARKKRTQVPEEKSTESENASNDDTKVGSAIKTYEKKKESACVAHSLRPRVSRSSESTENNTSELAETMQIFEKTISSSKEENSQEIHWGEYLRKTNLTEAQEDQSPPSKPQKKRKANKDEIETIWEKWLKTPVKKQKSYKQNLSKKVKKKYTDILNNTFPLEKPKKIRLPSQTQTLSTLTKTKRNSKRLKTQSESSHSKLPKLTKTATIKYLHDSDSETSPVSQEELHQTYLCYKCTFSTELANNLLTHLKYCTSLLSRPCTSRCSNSSKKRVGCEADLDNADDEFSFEDTPFNCNLNDMAKRQRIRGEDLGFTMSDQGSNHSSDLDQDDQSSDQLFDDDENDVPEHGQSSSVDEEFELNPQESEVSNDSPTKTESEIPVFGSSPIRPHSRPESDINLDDCQPGPSHPYNGNSSGEFEEIDDLDDDQNETSKEIPPEYTENSVVWVKLSDQYWPAIVAKNESGKVWIYTTSPAAPKRALKISKGSVSVRLHTFTDEKFNQKILSSVSSYEDPAQMHKDIVKSFSYVNKQRLFCKTIDDPMQYFDIPIEVEFESDDEVYEESLEEDSSDKQTDSENENGREVLDIASVHRCIQDGLCDDHVIGIYTQEIDCLRHTLFHEKNPASEKQLQELTWAAQGDPDMHLKFYEYFVDLFNKNKFAWKRDTATYIYEVWIPEAVVKAISIIRDISLDDAEAVFHMQERKECKKLLAQSP